MTGTVVPLPVVKKDFELFCVLFNRYPNLLGIFQSINKTVLQDVVDLLRGDSAVLDAAKKGNLSRVQKLIREEPSDS
jgi:hypothetical protein